MSPCALPYPRMLSFNLECLLRLFGKAQVIIYAVLKKARLCTLSEMALSDVQQMAGWDWDWHWDETVASTLHTVSCSRLHTILSFCRVYTILYWTE